MQINSINNVNFGVWKNEENSKKLLNKLLRQRTPIPGMPNISTQERNNHVRAMFDELAVSDNVYDYNPDLNRILKFDKRKNRLRNMHRRGYDLISALHREYSKLVYHRRLDVDSE